MLVIYIYRLLWLVLLPLLLFRLVLKSIKELDYLKRISERFGILPKNLLKKRQLNNKLIWIHCVSVGEFIAIKPLVDKLLLLPHQLLITSTTPSGSAQILKTYPSVLHTYLPFDVGFFYHQILSKLKPDICVLVETEIWANLLSILKKQQISSFLINARLSDKSFKKYQYMLYFSRFVINKIDMIAAQNQQSYDYFFQLKGNNNGLCQLGNIKFDIDITTKEDSRDKLKKMIAGRQVILFASTHDDEERQILTTYQAYKNQLDNTVLVIAPRHPKRSQTIINIGKKFGLNIVQYSDNTPCDDILLIDVFGELLTCYSLADICFIGGSLIKKGGHNPLEAIAFKKPVLFGKYMFNFPNISTELLQQKGAIQIQNVSDLFEKIMSLYTQPNTAKIMGENAYQYLLNHQGATERFYQKIKEILP